MRAAFDKSGMTQEQIGLKMGFTKDGARSAVSRLLNADSYDQRLSTLVAFANAVGKPLKDLAQLPQRCKKIEELENIFGGW